MASTFQISVEHKSAVSEVISGNVKDSIEADDGIEGGCDREDAVICSPPAEEEIAEVISQLKCNKVPGANEITSELFKLGGDSMVE